jgi:hypothetical protein
MREPPTYAAMEAFLRAHPRGPDRAAALSADPGARTGMTTDLAALSLPAMPPLTHVPIVDAWMEGDDAVVLLAPAGWPADRECVVRRSYDRGSCAYLLLDERDPRDDPRGRREGAARPMVLVGVRDRRTLVALPPHSLALLRGRIAALPEDRAAEHDRLRARFGALETFSRVKEAEADLWYGLTAELALSGGRDATLPYRAPPGTRLAIVDRPQGYRATTLSLRDPATGARTLMSLLWVVALEDRTYAILRHPLWYDDLPVGTVADSVALRVADAGTLVALGADEVEAIRVPVARAVRTLDRSPPEVVDAAFGRTGETQDAP